MNTYADDIHKHLRCKERKRFKFRGHSNQLQDRPKMIACLQKICQEKLYCSAAEHLAAYLLDIFMDNHRVAQEHLELVLVACVILSAKLEEQDKMPPKYSEFMTYLPQTYKKSEFFQLEVAILSFFKWDIMFPTVPHFAEYYIIFTLLPNDELNGRPLSSYLNINSIANKYVEYFLDVVVQEHEYLQFYPSIVAASCVACTRRCMTIRPIWPETLQSVTFYSYSQIEPCVELLLKALDEDMIKQQKEKSAKQKETSSKQIETSNKQNEISKKQKESSIGQKETSDRQKEASDRQKDMSDRQKESKKVSFKSTKRKLGCSEKSSNKIIKK